MKIDIRIRQNTPPRASDELREYARRRLHFGLGRVAARVASVTLRIADVSGPKGGLDVQCRLLLTTRSGATKVITALDSDTRVAMDAAIARGARAVRRELKRNLARRALG